MSGSNRYQEFLAKVDAKFAEIQRRHLEEMRCGRGCHSCCRPDLTVFRVEKENLADWIRSVPERETRLRELDALDPYRGTRCRFLGESGECAVYEARPLVCRTHGAPLFSKHEGLPRTDVCPLNFERLPRLEELPGSDFFNLDLINTLLAALNRDIDSAGTRTPLRLEAVLGTARSTD